MNICEPLFNLFIYSPPMFTDLTLAMQKLYQTFVAQAAQLQSVHENVKVGSSPLAPSEKYETLCSKIVCDGESCLFRHVYRLSRIV